MLRWIVRSSLQGRVFVALAAAGLLIVGVGQLRTARVDLLPEFGPSYVEVQTEALGLSAAEVEDLITIPLEEGLLNGLPWVATMRSESVPGLSSIALVLEPGADPIRARQMVQERLTQARVLPNVSKPPAMLEPRSSSGRALMIGLGSTELSPIDLGVLARWTIRPRLLGVPGVSNVAIWGQRERQVAVQVDPQRLREKVVTLDQVIETTGNALWVSPLSFLEASSPGAGGFIDTANQRLTVQHLLSIRKPQDLAEVRIEGCTGGRPTQRRHVDANCPTAPTIAPAVLDTRFAQPVPGGSQTSWPSNPGGTNWLADDAYRLAVRQAGAFVGVGAPLNETFGDVEVSATFRKTGGPSGGGYGLILRDQAPEPRDGTNQVGRFYVLAADDRGEVGIWRRDNSAWIDLVPWTHSDAVRVGGAPNELTAVAIGSRLVLRVNGQEAASVIDGTLTDGRVGAFAGGDGNEVALDRFTLKSADDTRPSPPRSPLRLGDVATVVEDHQPLIGDAVVNGGTGLLLVVEKLPWANTLDVTRGVEAALDDLRPGLNGVSIDTAVFRPASFIERAWANLGLVVMLGALLVLLALGALYFDWRRLAISLVTIPLSLVAAALVLELRGVTLNAMVLAGLALGVSLVLHDAVTVVDHLARRLRQFREAESARPVADEPIARVAADLARQREVRAVLTEASLETGRSLAYAGLIVGLSVIPVFALDGLSGAFLQPLVVAYGLAVLASFLVVLTVAPALGLLLLSRSGGGGGESRLAAWFQRGYAGLLNRWLRLPQLATLALVLLGAIGLVLTPRMTQAAFPSFREQNVMLRVNAPAGTSLPVMTQLVNEASGALRAVPGVRTVAGGVGRAVLSDRVGGVSTGEIWVSIDPVADYTRTLADVRGVAERYPWLSRDALTYSEDRLRTAATGSGDDLVVRVYGLDFADLRQKAEEVRQSIAQVDGIIAPRTDEQTTESTIDVEVDLARAQEFAVKPGDVRRSVTSLIAGISVGSLFEEQKVFDVVVIGVPQLRQSAADVSALLVDTLTGGQVPLGNVAAVRLTPNPSSIKRDSVARYVDVTASVRGRDLQAVVGDVERRVRAVPMPREFHAEILGDLGQRQAGQQRFLGYAAAAALAIFLLLQAAFGSWRLAVLVSATLALALAGGLIAAFIGGGVLSLGSYAGCLAIVGLAAREGILSIGEYQRRRRLGDGSSMAELFVRVTHDRMPAVLTSAVVIGLPMLLLIMLGDRPGNEILRPMAIVILGGLLASTALVLLIAPSLCLRFMAVQPRQVPAVALAVAATPNPPGSEATSAQD